MQVVLKLGENTVCFAGCPEDNGEQAYYFSRTTKLLQMGFGGCGVEHFPLPVFDCRRAT